MGVSGQKGGTGRPARRAIAKGPRRERTLQKLAYEAGLDCTLSYIRVTPEQRVAYAAACALRAIDIAPQDLRRSPAPRPALRAGSSAKEQWIRDNLYAKGWDRAETSNQKPLWIKADAVGRGPRDSCKMECMDQLKTWVELWTSEDVEARWCGGRVGGLGVFASRRLPAGREAVSAVVDRRSGEGCSCETLGEGADGAVHAWFGAASLVNAACGKCATAVFRRRNGRRVVVVREDRGDLSKGREVTVPYVQGGRPMCCGGCGVALTSETTRLRDAHGVPV